MSEDIIQILQGLTLCLNVIVLFVLFRNKGSVNGSLNALRKFIYSKICANCIYNVDGRAMYSFKRRVNARRIFSNFSPQGVEGRKEITAKFKGFFGNEILCRSGRIIKTEDLAHQFIHLEDVLLTLNLLFKLTRHKSYLGNLLDYIGIDGEPLFVEDFLELFSTHYELDVNGNASADSTANKGEGRSGGN